MNRYERLMQYTKNHELASFFESSFPSFADTLFMYYNVKEYEALSAKIYQKYSDIQQNSSLLTFEYIISRLDLTEDIIDKIDIKRHKNFYYLADFGEIKLENKNQIITHLFVAFKVIADFSKKFKINPANKIGYDNGLISLHCWSDLFGEFCISDFQENMDEALPIFAILKQLYLGIISADYSSSNRTGFQENMDEALPIFAILKQLYLGIIPADYSSSNRTELIELIKDSMANRTPRIPLLTLYAVHKIDFFLTMYLIINHAPFMQFRNRHSWDEQFKLIISDNWNSFRPRNPKIDNEEDFQDYFILSISQHGWKIKFFELPKEDRKFTIKISTTENDFSSDNFIINVYYKIFHLNTISCYAQVRSTKKVFATQKNQYNLFDKIEYSYEKKVAIYILENILSLHKNHYTLNPELWLDMNEETELNVKYTLMEFLSLKNIEVPIKFLKNCCLYVKNNRIYINNDKHSNISSQCSFVHWYENIKVLRNHLNLCNTNKIVINNEKSTLAKEYNCEKSFDEKWNDAINKNENNEEICLFYKIQKWLIFENATNKDILEKIKKEFPNKHSFLTKSKHDHDKEIAQSTLTKVLSNLVTDSRNFAENNELPCKPQKVGKKKSPKK